ncbi:low molecular weight protein-tyrosine-phosphatase [Cellulomonas citrea]|uniref:low molecular weight protein-tyrosine-phosphatase n=1 Tax=Cellulomonas citrea TaxID=1909423 RepID=UPI001F3B860C|nr:low molecular weight protein-tyrosine-phosphatase [Cellulomonas citrea]
MPIRVMTVCTGNICRSPMAEVVLRAGLEAAGLGDLVVVDSRGTSDEEHGNPIDPRARRALLARGYPGGDGHRARQVTADELGSRDLVLAMTAGHARALRNLAGRSDEARRSGEPAGRILLYRALDPAAPVGGPEHLLDLDDPWYGPDSAFEVCLDQVEAAAAAVVQEVATLVAQARGGLDRDLGRGGPALPG